MGDFAGEPDLLLEALERDAAPHERFGTERLDRHRLLQLAVERPVHHTHPAHPEDLLHLVAVGEQRARAQPASRRGPDGRSGALELLRGRGSRRGHHVLDELRLLLQVRHQTLERLRQHADLVAGGDADFHAVVPVLHPARGERQPPDRARDLPRQHVGRGEREQQPQHDREPDGALQRPERSELAIVRAERHEPAERVATGGADRARQPDEPLAVHVGGQLRARRVARQGSHRPRVGHERRLDRLARQGGADDIGPVERVERKEHHVGGGRLPDLVRERIIDRVGGNEGALRRRLW